MRFFALVVLLAGCRDNGLVVYDLSPEVTITSPLSGAEFAEGEAITFDGLVSDDGPEDGLAVSWQSSLDGMLEEDAVVDAEGRVQLITSALQPGEHVIVLRAFDSGAQSADATVSINVVDVPDAPAITIVHPDLAGLEKGLDAAPFVFMAKVTDAQDAPENLTVELLANPYGVVCTMVPDGAGTAQCAATLPLGPYVLTFTARDSDGFESMANANFQVVTRGDWDADLDGYSPNGGDCNDSNKNIYPGAKEICDGLDNDCNTLTGIDVGTECYDDDGDRFCEKPPCVNTSQTLSDCDDTNPARYPNPAATELPNGVDDDCDGTIDETTVVYDDDGDGYCESPPCVNAAGTKADCNDANAMANPGMDEICSDGFDNDCNGQDNEEDAIGCSEFYYDGDGDTFGVTGKTQCWCDNGVAPWTGLDTDDCYDKNADANPDQTAFFGTHRGDSKYDYDCDGSQEKQYTGTSGGCSWDFEPFSCEVDGEGWDGSEPACGKSGKYISDCESEYDAWCIFWCAYADPSLCTDCWACDEDVATTTQGCR